MLSFYDFSPKKALCVSSLFLSVFLASTSSWAQVEAATKSADPARAQKERMDLQKAIPLSPSYEVKDAILQKAPDGAENIKFQLQKIEIEGVTAYTTETLQNLYQDKLGKTISLADIYALSTTITNKYRNEGYILTQVYVPPQTIDGGVVKLRVVEGFVDKITVQGEKIPSEAVLIQQYAENLKQKTVLNAKDLERNLLLINDLPGVTARTILSPSKTTVGAADMTVIVERDRYDAEIGFDNFGSRFLGAYEGIASGSLNSYFGQNELISGQFVMAGDKDKLNELAFGSIVYEKPVWHTGAKARFEASRSDTRPGYTLREFDVKGRSEFLSGGISYPIIRSRDLNLYVRSSLDYRNARSANNIEDTRRDKITTMRGGVNLQFMDTLFAAAVNSIDFEVAQGFSLFGASDKGDSNLSRTRGEPQYTKANLSVQRLQRLTPKANLLIAAEGQRSADPLLSAEEFGVGGMNGIGRGYDPSEIVGDDGMAGKLELQINKPVEIKNIYDYQLFTFLDSGKVWNKDATSSADKVQSLTSMGFGVRADITEKTKAGFAVAIPLTKNIDTHGDKDIRLLFNLSHAF